MKINIPYYKTYMELNVDDRNLKAVLTPDSSKLKVDFTEVELIKNALDNPIGTKKLSELALGKNKITIITSDHTRAVPSKITLPVILSEIRRTNPNVEITILIATGLHRATTDEEQRSMFGDEIVDNERIVINDAFNDEQFSHVCTLPSGAELHVNKEAINCDLLVTEGFIEPHFFAGFSGGRKSVLPGVCNKETINENHSYKAIAHENAKTGILKGNPVHEDMVCAARALNVQFIFNVVLDESKKIIGAFAGDLERAHEKGVEFVKSISQCRIVKGDIVVTSNGGYPLDQNLYQSPKAVATAEACAEKDAVIVMCCSCFDGVGGDHFEKLIMSGTAIEIDEKLSKIDPKDTISEQWSAQVYSRILKKHKIILVTTYLDHEVVRKSNMIPAKSLDEAMDIAYKIKGKDSKVVVIPDGVGVLAIES